jgi:hypothetical protein
VAWTPGEETRNTARAGRSHTIYTCTHFTAKAARGVQVQLQLGLLPFLFCYAPYIPKRTSLRLYLFRFRRRLRRAHRPTHRRPPSVIPVIRTGNGNWQMGARLLVADGSATAPHFLLSGAYPSTSSLLRPSAPVETASAFLTSDTEARHQEDEQRDTMVDLVLKHTDATIATYD